MEAISMKCPNCMGDVVPFGNGVYGRCTSCDSVFKLKDDEAETAAAVSDDVEEDEDEEEGFDFEQFFQDAYDEYVDDESDLSDAYFGDRLDDNPDKIDAAVKHFGIDDDDADEVYCVVDTTIFGSCKVGFAVTVSGVYMVDEDGTLRLLTGTTTTTAGSSATAARSSSAVTPSSCPTMRPRSWPA